METIGFLGLGTMGEPMAMNLQRAGFPLVVWNRDARKGAALAQAGAGLAASVEEVFARCSLVLAMLADGAALDAVLARDTPDFAQRLSGRLLVNMATNSAAYSQGLEAAVRAAGGRYVEAPVSGSRKPAEAGQLVAMLAGEPEDLERLRPVLAPLCRQIVPRGAVPGGIRTKISTHLFLIAMVTALAEATNLAARQGLDLVRFSEVILGGPLASEVARVKVPKLAQRDFTPQAAIRNVLESNRLVVEAAREARVPTPLADACLRLNEAALAQGFGDEDMVAVLKAYETLVRQDLPGL
jgi:3-hydroxyisobutyrate dehydrogenase